MATYTPNFHLEKPDPTDFYDVAVPNANNSTIDGVLKEHEDGIGELQANKADKPIHPPTVTLPAAGWSTSTGAITVSVPGVTADPACFVHVRDADTATFEQKSAWYNAGIVGGTQGAGTIQLISQTGYLPSVDIPLDILIVGGATS